MAKDTKIVIKKGSMKLELDRGDLIEVNETHDGLVFNFKGGGSYYYVDNYMPAGVKDVMKNTANHFTEQKIIFDLDNPKQPVMVDAT